MVRVKVCTIEPSELFICEVHGEVTVDGLAQIEADIRNDFWFPTEADWIECECTYDHGETGDDGRYTVPPGWVIVLSGHGIEPTGGDDA